MSKDVSAPFLWCQRQSKIPPSREVVKEIIHIQKCPMLYKMGTGAGKKAQQNLSPSRTKAASKSDHVSLKAGGVYTAFSPSWPPHPHCCGLQQPRSLPSPAALAPGLQPSSCSLPAPALAASSQSWNMGTKKVTHFHSYITFNLALGLPTTEGWRGWVDSLAPGDGESGSGHSPATYAQEHALAHGWVAPDATVQ